MKAQTKKYLFIILLFAAVYGVVLFRNAGQQRRMESLPDDGIVGGGKPVLLELGASWCGYCRQMIPILNDLDNEQDVFAVAYLDVDKAREKAQGYGVEGIPVLIFFGADGSELYRHVGYWPKADILKKWQELGLDVK